MEKKEKEDELLNDISTSISRLHENSKDINKQLTDHITIISNFDDDIDSGIQHLTVTNKKIDKINENKNGKIMCRCILFLIIVLIVLIIVISIF